MSQSTQKSALIKLQQNLCCHCSVHTYTHAHTHICTHACTHTHLLLGLEDVASEGVAGALPGDVAEDPLVLGVVGHVEDAVDGVLHDEELVVGVPLPSLRGKGCEEGTV